MRSFEHPFKVGDRLERLDDGQECEVKKTWFDDDGLPAMVVGYGDEGQGTYYENWKSLTKRFKLIKEEAENVWLDQFETN